MGTLLSCEKALGWARGLGFLGAETALTAHRDAFLGGRAKPQT